MTRLALAVPAAALLMAAVTAAPAFAENRCGWLNNPTPGNWWLADADGEWTIAVQGNYQAPGMDNISDMQEGQWVAANGNYGYACFCLDVDTDGQGAITYIYSSRQLRLSKCRRDPALEEPSTD